MDTVRNMHNISGQCNGCMPLPYTVNSSVSKSTFRLINTHTFVCPCAISSHAETLTLGATVKKAGFENKLRRLQNAFGAFTKFEFRLTSEIEKMTKNALNTTPDSQTCPSLNANQRCFFYCCSMIHLQIILETMGIQGDSNGPSGRNCYHKSITESNVVR